MEYGIGTSRSWHLNIRGERTEAGARKARALSLMSEAASVKGFEDETDVAEQKAR